MLYAKYENYENFEIKVDGEWVNVAGITDFKNTISRTIRKVNRYDKNGRPTVHSFFCEETYDITCDLLGKGEDVGNNYLVGLARLNGDDCKTEFRFTQPWTGEVTEGVVFHDVKLTSDDAMTFTDTMYVDGETTESQVEEPIEG